MDTFTPCLDSEDPFLPKKNSMVIILGPFLQMGLSITSRLCILLDGLNCSVLQNPWSNYTFCPVCFLGPSKQGITFVMHVNVVELPSKTKICKRDNLVYLHFPLYSYEITL